MFETLKNAFKVKDIRRKILITIFLLIVFRLGCWLPIPGLNPSFYLSGFFKDDGARGNTLLDLLGAITGGALSHGAFLSLGISPYINASIIFQLLTVAIPPLERLSKQGEEGRRKLNQITRIGTLVLALAQSVGVAINWANEGNIADIFGFGVDNVTASNWVVGIFVVIILVTGAMFTMWLGEKITELGIGNGISLIIFVGIIATAGQGLVYTMFYKFIPIIKGPASSEPIQFGDPTSLMALWELLGFLAMVLFIFIFIIWVDLAERRINIQYAKQVKGRKLYGGQSTHIPIKVNANGVLPIIFASALTSFPMVIMGMIPNAKDSGFGIWYERFLSPNGKDNYVYMVVTALLIFLFSFFYAQIQFKPDEVSRNIQQYGGFIPGIRPGRPTTEYLAKISKRLTFFGAFFLAFLALVPSVVFRAALGPGSALINAFSATGLLIVVSIALELEKQLEGQLMMKHYKGFLK